MSSMHRRPYLSPSRKAEEWKERGLCRETDPEAWFPEYGERAEKDRQAVQVCKACPVWRECRKYAMQTPDPTGGHGTWGGLTEKQRAKIRRASGEVHASEK
jgi:WhiB family transcriptional regulator, redox-sensing transcriptional regulator